MLYCIVVNTQNIFSSLWTDHILVFFQKVTPTPRVDRISRDYAQEYPSIEIEGRRVINKPDQQKNMDNVKLNEEEADSDDEWQGLIDTSDPETDPENGLKLLNDATFTAKLKKRIKNCSDQVKEGGLEGASKLRTALRVTMNLLTLKW